MRIFAALLALAAAAPAAAQPPPALPNATLEALRRDFPEEHRALAASLAGKGPEETRRLAYSGIERFLRGRRDRILAAPATSLVAIEARQGALLRALGSQDVRLCAAVGDSGFFSVAALAGPAPPGLDDYGVALVEAAKAGIPGSASAPPASRDDYLAWLAVVDKIEPWIPVRAMLTDRSLRFKSSPDNLCRGAAAMHEAVASLSADRGARVARTLLGSVIGSAAR
jgi:hypothetical protein